MRGSPYFFQNIYEKLFAPLPTPDQMKIWDMESRKNFGVPEDMLMENAAREALHVLEEKAKYGLLAPFSSATRVLIFAGGGNNGGDGFALGRSLHDKGCRVLILHTRPLGKMKGAAGKHARMAMRSGVRMHFVPRAKSLESVLLSEGQEWFEPEIVVDAISGTGLKGGLREESLALVRFVNKMRHSFVCSLDVPSGLNALTGQAEPEAVRADLTVSFEAAKSGLCLPEASPFVGNLQVRSIGIPALIKEKTPADFRLLQAKKGCLVAPDPLAHKGTLGRVLIIGGSCGFEGAPLLAALGAMRAGAALVSVALPDGLVPYIKAGFPEIMTVPLGSGSTWNEEHVHNLCKVVAAMGSGGIEGIGAGRSALVMGPGLGKNPIIPELVRAVLSVAGRPATVLDADALWAFYPPAANCSSGMAGGHSTTVAAGISELSSANGIFEKIEEIVTTLPLELLQDYDIVTPHPKEMAGLLAFESAGQVQQNRVEALRLFCSLSQSTAILKGAGTLIGQAKKTVTISPFATSALAVGGSGDVLSGICAAFCAKTGIFLSGENSLLAACLAVQVHGRAGELVGDKFSAGGNSARDICAAIPAAMMEML